MRKDEAVLAVIEAQQATIDRQMTTIEAILGQMMELTKAVVAPEPVPTDKPPDIYDQELEPTSPDRDPAELDWPSIQARLSGQMVEGWEDADS